MQALGTGLLSHCGRYPPRLFEGTFATRAPYRFSNQFTHLFFNRTFVTTIPDHLGARGLKRVDRMIKIGIFNPKANIWVKTISNLRTSMENPTPVLEKDELMGKQFPKEEWNYVATPGFVVRFQDEVFQLRHLETSEWFDCNDLTLLRQITQDGWPLSEKETEEIFIGMQKRHLKYKESN